MGKSIIDFIMKKLRIYLDTSVIGGCFDEEFKQYSIALFKEFDAGSYIAVISATTLAELKNAPNEVKEIVKTIPGNNYEELMVSDEMQNLSAMYLADKIVSEKYSDDALHIAIATVSNVDLLVSWNFKHIVNYEKIHRFNAINTREGYGFLEIMTPREVINYDK